RHRSSIPFPTRRSSDLVAAVRRELKELIGDDADVRGLRVYTAIDPALQKAAERALVAQLERIEAGSYGRWPHEKPAPGEKLEPRSEEHTSELQSREKLV